MKKHLIAAAVAGAFAVPAMAQVTVSGVLIYDLLNTQEIKDQTGPAAATTLKDTQTGYVGGRSWTASQLSFAGAEDLGGGLTASFVTNVDLRPATGGLFTRDQNLALSGGFGTVRVGRFIPASAMGFHGFSGAATTTVGSIYGLGVGLMETAAGAANGTGGGAGTYTAQLTGGSFERNANLVQYTSPNISGLTVNVSVGQDTSDASATASKRELKQQGIGVSYAAGPLSAALGTNTRDNKAEALAGSEAELTWIGASYNLGVAVVSATQVKREGSTIAAGTGVKTKADDFTINAVGVSVPMGAITFAASMYDGENEASAATTDNVDLSGYQASVRYALSKRTTVYAVIGENEVKRASGNTGGISRTVSGNMIGLMHSF
jgi:predicted porin